MNLKDLQHNWNAIGEDDPLYGVLSHPDKKNGKWDAEEFFRLGREEIAAVLRDLTSYGVVLHKGRALDFGCGVGRLTQALAAHFVAAVGVDIAPSMIRLAQQFDAAKRCRFVLNDRPDLRLFPSGQFDFIYSNIVLQHMRPDLAAGYIREFFRILRPQGIMVFQLPSHCAPLAEPVREPPAPPLWRQAVKAVLPASVLAWYRRRHEAPPERGRQEMYGTPKADVLHLIVDAGGDIIDVTENTDGGPGWVSWRYCARKA